MEAETPQTAPPTPITAHSRLSRPNALPMKKMVRQVRDRNKRCLSEGNGASGCYQRERKGSAQEHDTNLDEIFDPQSCIEPAGQRNEIGDNEAKDQSKKCSFEIVFVRVQPSRIR